MATRPFRKPHSTLTPRQDAFAREYLADLNASAAARRAGFSAKTAGRQAIALLTKPHVLARIQQLQAERNRAGAGGCGLGAAQAGRGTDRRCE